MRVVTRFSGMGDAHDDDVDALTRMAEWLGTGVDLDVASIFDPFGNAVHTALQFPVLGEDVLITGAGPIGIIAAGICKHVGARNVVVTDVNDYRLQASRIGHCHAIFNARRATTTALP